MIASTARIATAMTVGFTAPPPSTRMARYAAFAGFTSEPSPGIRSPRAWTTNRSFARIAKCPGERFA